jgi:hypothetical protein
MNPKKMILQESKNQKSKIDFIIIMAKYSKKAQKKIEKVMHEFKHGELKSGKSGKGGIVKSRKQAIAIGINEAQKAGLKVPKKKP